ncbi:MAG TPA: tetratricopeptide repeat protein [Anaerolineae bacterium]|nr:tetratricopeptide repeat protein [Anaerolineae bacterium]
MYLSVFYAAFRWLGVLRGRRDRNLLIGLWVGMGLLVAALFTLWRGPVYVGVAYPFGTILGLVIYLIYYALTAEPPETEEAQPFAGDRLLVTALAAAVLAHYVEIHFGIAIAATRVYFFLYTALLFMVTYLLPRLKEMGTAVPVESSRRGKRSRRQPRQAAPAKSAGWGPLLLNTLVMALIIGVMGYTFITYNQPPGQTGEELIQLTAGDIFQQSFFQDASKDFVDSPFIYLMVILTWGLGVLIMVSEMVKDKELRVPANLKALARNRQKIAAVIFLLMGAGSIGFRLVASQPANAGATALLGQSLLWLWGAVSIWAGVRLLVGKGDADRVFAGGVALAGLLLSLPVFLAGGEGVALVTAVICAVILYLLWDKVWSKFFLPVGALGAVSLTIGLGYAYFQAFQLRNSLLYRFTLGQPETALELQKFVVAEADYAVQFLVYFFVFVILLLAVAALVLSLAQKPAAKKSGSAPAYLLLLGLVIFGGWFVFASNVQVIQADMVYKRGRFFDNEAARARNLENWDSAIAIYQNALERAPNEDFYYLFLGRAYLERSTLTEDPDEKVRLLSDAEDRLLLAQKINPLNTDHTANLARLNTRWVALTDDEAARQERIDQAEKYYLDALSLSPQNSVIRNEYARLLLNLKQDCSGAIRVFEDSVAIDPYYTETYFDLAQTYQACAAGQPEDAQEEMKQKAAETVLGATEQRPNDSRVWVRAGQILHDLGDYEGAVAAYEQVRQLDPQGQLVTSWNLDFLLAQSYAAQGQIEQAVVLTQNALVAAPPQYTEQIQQFLNQLTGGG